MSFLYARYAWWRAIVSASRDPKKLVLITAVSSAGFGSLAYAIQGLTGRMAETNNEKIRSEISRDREATRYASHSKRALEVILADAVGKEAPEHKHPMKMPQVHWHPGALKRSANAFVPSAEQSQSKAQAETKSPTAAEPAQK